MYEYARSRRKKNICHLLERRVLTRTRKIRNNTTPIARKVIHPVWVKLIDFVSMSLCHSLKIESRFGNIIENAQGIISTDENTNDVKRSCLSATRRISGNTRNSADWWWKRIIAATNKPSNKGKSRDLFTISRIKKKNR